MAGAWQCAIYLENFPRKKSFAGRAGKTDSKSPLHTATVYSAV
jgi:hypothetical protein